MGFTRKRYHYKDPEMVDYDSDNRVCLRMEHARECAQSVRRMDVKMRIFLSMVAIGCFLYNYAFAATLRTAMDLQAEVEQTRITPVSLKQMSIKELTEIEI